MSRPTENNGGTSIPRFGGWGEKGATNYSVIFSRARDKKKQCKSDVMHGPGNDNAFVAASWHKKPDSDSDDTIQKKHKFLACVNCCFKP